MDTSPLAAGDLVLSFGSLPGTDLAGRLAPARDAGFRGVSVGLADVATAIGDEVRLAELGRAVVDHDLVVGEFDAITTWDADHVPPASMGATGAALAWCTAENLCPLAAAVGARSVTVVEYFGTRLGVDRGAAAFAAVCDRAADHGLLVTLEFLPWTGVATLAEARAIVEAAGRPNGLLQVDSWHLFRGGGTLAELAALPGELLGYVQLDDAPADPEPDLEDESVHRRLAPGAGDLDLVGFVRTLRGIGYDGPIGVEVLADELGVLPPAEAARRCGDGARAVLAAA